MKKIFPVLILLLVFVTAFASAQSYYHGNNLGDNLGYGMEQLIDTIQEMFYPLFSIILGGYGDYMFERILFLFILTALLYVVVSRMDVFKKNLMVIWVVTISISLLSTRFLTESDLVQTMLLPYSVLGVALTAALPMLIYFFFVESFNESSTVRKMLWIFFIVVFIGLWASRYDELGQMSWIYMVTAILAFFFLLFDGTIRRAIEKGKIRDNEGIKKEQYLAEANKKLKEHRDGEGNWTNKTAWKKKEKQLIDYLEKLRKKKY